MVVVHWLQDITNGIHPDGGPMRFIPTRVHGMLDWLMGPLLIALPFLLKLDLGQPEGWLPLVLGIAMVLLTMFTDYEVGLVRRIPMGTHLAIDTMTGLLLAVSPWLFGFSDRIWQPYLVLGLIELGTALTTQLRPVGRTARSAAR
jgi:hypothetical protein